MNAEKVLSSINLIVEKYAPNASKAPEFEALAQSLREEIALAEQKKAGRSDRFKAALRFSKVANKANLGRRFGLAGAYVMDGKQYIVHDHLAVCFDTPMDGLVEAGKGERFTSFDKVIEPRYKSVELPSMADVKTQAKLAKAEGNLDKHGIHRVEIDGVQFNSKLLIQIMEMVGDGEAYLCNNSNFSPLVLIGNGARGVVLPMRKEVA